MQHYITQDFHSFIQTTLSLAYLSIFSHFFHIRPVFSAYVIISVRQMTCLFMFEICHNGALILTALHRTQMIISTLSLLFIFPVSSHLIEILLAKILTQTNNVFISPLILFVSLSVAISVPFKQKKPRPHQTHHYKQMFSQLSSLLKSSHLLSYVII